MEEPVHENRLIDRPLTVTKPDTDDRRLRQLRRVWALLVVLRHGGTLARLAFAVGVTQRTIRRDLAALRALGLPVFRDGPTAWRLRLDSACPLCSTRDVVHTRQAHDRAEEDRDSRSRRCAMWMPD
jgi:hypothetical protein